MAASETRELRESSFDRRKALALLGTGGIAFAGAPAIASTQEEESGSDIGRVDPTVAAMQQNEQLQAGWIVHTLGYHEPGDGGEALYRIVAPDPERTPNNGDVIALDNGKHATLLAGNSVNYRMFGAKGDGKNDDGVQIKLAHEFASRNNLPIIQRSGEYWIIKTHSIPITTNVEWGNTIFHINEKHNQKRSPRFIVKSLKSSRKIELDEQAKKSFLEKLKPGVQIISEMAPYKNCLISIADANDRIGFRAGERYQGQSWAREELFYVEEDGRILGDIAWEFKDYTSLTARPCDDGYLVIDGGGFYLSGDNPGEKYTGYYQNGFSIRRSRTIIRNQWMGLEPDHHDVSMEPRSGFYSFRHVFDATLENIRLIPWEQNRSDPEKKVGAGTYGISGARMLNCTFRNITAEGSWLHWGVFGTNLNKNFRIEKCRLNRVDVHFHCWNLTIQDSEIGLRGISITGGGNLVIENTIEHGNSLVNFRRDFGAKWDGDIRIRNCTLVPTRNGTVSVLSSRPSEFDYRYPLGLGRTIDIENLLIDYSNSPGNTAAAWIFNIAPFSKSTAGPRLFFAHQITVRNVTVSGRQQGVRLLAVPSPYHYDVGRDGSYDGVQLVPNCRMVFENVLLEEFPATKANDTANVHLRLGGKGSLAYQDTRALYPHIRVTNCPNFSAFLGGSAAEVVVNDATIDRFTAAADGPLRGMLRFNDCRFTPNVTEESSPLYALDAELGTYLTNCTIHAPRLSGEPKPELIDKLDFVQPNTRVRYCQLNTTFGNDLLKYFEEKEIALQPAFIAMLKSHHALEPENVPSPSGIGAADEATSRK